MRNGENSLIWKRPLKRRASRITRDTALKQYLAEVQVPAFKTGRNREGLLSKTSLTDADSRDSGAPREAAWTQSCLGLSSWAEQLGSASGIPLQEVQVPGGT